MGLSLFGRPTTPTVSDADKPLRRQVAMAYRTALEAGRSHHKALDAAKAVYYDPNATYYRRRQIDESYGGSADWNTLSRRLGPPS